MSRATAPFPPPGVACVRAACVLFASLLLTGCGEDPFPSFDELDKLRGLWGLSERAPEDPTNAFQTHPDAIALGKKLFSDPALSSCGTVSCATCHPAPGYAIEKAAAPGCDGNLTARNAPSLLNIGHHAWLMWDGRADRLWSQALLPLMNPVEMNSNPELVRARLSEFYPAEYTGLFGTSPAEEEEGRMLANFGKALAAYETTLTSPRVSFDDGVQRYIAAAEAGQAESDPLHAGLKTFFRSGRCIACHQGPSLSDDKFHNVGLEDSTPGRVGQHGAIEALLASEFRGDGVYSDAPEVGALRIQDLEERLLTERPKMEGAFRTPSLRNLSMTGPYMHNGSFATLEEVIDFYDEGGARDGTFAGIRAETILPLNLTDEEKESLLQLLQTLSP